MCGGSYGGGGGAGYGGARYGGWGRYAPPKQSAFGQQNYGNPGGGLDLLQAGGVNYDGGYRPEFEMLRPGGVNAPQDAASAGLLMSGLPFWMQRGAFQTKPMRMNDAVFPPRRPMTGGQLNMPQDKIKGYAPPPPPPFKPPAPPPQNPVSPPIYTPFNHPLGDGMPRPELGPMQEGQYGWQQSAETEPTAAFDPSARKYITHFAGQPWYGNVDWGNALASIAQLSGVPYDPNDPRWY